MPAITGGLQGPKKPVSVEGRSSVSRSVPSSSAARSSSVSSPSSTAASPSTEKRAQQLAEALSALYKQLNQKWEALEKKLRELVPPRQAWIVYARQEDDELQPQGSFCACLGLMKHRGDWRICHGWFYNVQECEPDSWKPIVECSVEERVAAVEHVDKLRDAILAEAEKSIPVVTDAVAKLAGALES